jgi:hypothetical protein
MKQAWQTLQYMVLIVESGPRSRVQRNRATEADQLMVHVRNELSIQVKVGRDTVLLRRFFLWLRSEQWEHGDR